MRVLKWQPGPKGINLYGFMALENEWYWRVLRALGRSSRPPVGVCHPDLIPKYPILYARGTALPWSEKNPHTTYPGKVYGRPVIWDPRRCWLYFLGGDHAEYPVR